MFRLQKMTSADQEIHNQFDQVDDFKWLKSEPSPNWSILDASQRTRDDVWRDVVPGQPGLGPEDVLKAVNLPGL